LQEAAPVAMRIERNCTMPNPKRRHSVRRTGNRRAHDHLTANGVSECPNCHEKKLPHRACPKCKTYRSRGYGETEEK
jgi:large subunit ribosomal protein L32